jgi:hypothetical protein
MSLLAGKRPGEDRSHRFIAFESNVVVGTVDAIDDGQRADQNLAAAPLQLAHQLVLGLLHLAVGRHIGIETHVDAALAAVVKVVERTVLVCLFTLGVDELADPAAPVPATAQADGQNLLLDAIAPCGQRHDGLFRLHQSGGGLRVFQHLEGVEGQVEMRAIAIGADVFVLGLTVFVDVLLFYSRKSERPHNVGHRAPSRGDWQRQ